MPGMGTVFDREEMARRLGNDDGMLREIVSVYLQDTVPQIAQLKSANREQHMEPLLRISHTIKGSSANVAAREIEHIAARIEHAARTGEIDGISVLVVELEDAFTRFHQEIAGWLQA